MTVRVPALAVALAILSACSGPHTSNGTADVNAAAAQAQGDIDTYAANSLASAPAKAPDPAPLVTPSVAVTRPAVVEAPFSDDSAQGAANVVQTYFALIEQKRYGDAWALWDDGGRASGMTRRQFADSFARYANYHAEVGAPGRVDAGAGQRYVEVPVRAYGTLIDGKRPFAMRGMITLHRTADIDGATAEQKSWHIRGSALKPRPAEAAAATDAGASYKCAGATRVSARDDTIPPPDADEARRTKGIWYRGDAGEATVPCSAGG